MLKENKIIIEMGAKHVNTCGAKLKVKILRKEI